MEVFDFEVPLHVGNSSSEMYLASRSEVKSTRSFRNGQRTQVALVGSSTLCDPHVWRSLVDSGKDCTQPIQLIIERDVKSASAGLFDDPLFCDELSNLPQSVDVSAPEEEANSSAVAKGDISINICSDDSHRRSPECQVNSSFNTSSPMDEDGVQQLFGAAQHSPGAPNLDGTGRLLFKLDTDIEISDQFESKEVAGDKHLSIERPCPESEEPLQLLRKPPMVTNSQQLSAQQPGTAPTSAQISRKRTTEIPAIDPKKMRRNVAEEKVSALLPTALAAQPPGKVTLMKETHAFAREKGLGNANTKYHGKVPLPNFPKPTRIPLGATQNAESAATNQTTHNIPMNGSASALDSARSRYADAETPAPAAHGLRTPAAASGTVATMFSSAKGSAVNVSASALDSARSRYADAEPTEYVNGGAPVPECSVESPLLQPTSIAPSSVSSPPQAVSETSLAMSSPQMPSESGSISRIARYSNEMFDLDAAVHERRPLRSLVAGLPSKDVDSALACGVSATVVAVDGYSACRICFSEEDSKPTGLCHCCMPHVDDNSNEPCDPCACEVGKSVRAMIAALVEAGADPAIADEVWVKHHYNMVVWKLASLERSFPNEFAGRALTWERVVAQLRYRYEREVIRGHKSPIWSVLAGDASPDSAMVLCLRELAGSVARLSDGWYDVACQLDPALTHFAAMGRLQVGGKVAIGGAVLEGNSASLEGHPLDALRKVANTSEAEDNTSEDEPVKPPTLSVHANGVRRVAWDTKLGFLPRPTLRVKLRSIFEAGGVVPSVDVVVVRSYPPLWRSTDPVTGVVARLGAHEEQKAKDAHERRCVR